MQEVRLYAFLGNTPVVVKNPDTLPPGTLVFPFYWTGKLYAHVPGTEYEIPRALVPQGTEEKERAGWMS